MGQRVSDSDHIRDSDESYRHIVSELEKVVNESDLIPDYDLPAIRLLARAVALSALARELREAWSLDIDLHKLKASDTVRFTGHPSCT